MARARYIHGIVIGWDNLLLFLDTLQPWQTMLDSSVGRMGALDDTFRRTAAAAAGTCTTNHRFPDNLLDVLEMIARKHPKPFRWHGQISPERWTEANSYTGALSGWLAELTAEQSAVSFLLDEEITHRIYSYLGTERSKLKVAMVKRYLCHAVHHLTNTTSLAIIGDADRIPKHQVRYQNFTRAWRWDGVQCEKLQPTDKPIRDLDDIILASGISGTSFLDYLRLESSPICHQRILRHMEVVIFRIGSEWTDPEGLPPGSGGATQLRRLQADYMESLSRWYDDRSAPDQPEARKVHEQVCHILGKPDERKRALVDCLAFRSSSAEDLQEAAFSWLRVNGCTPLQALGGCVQP